MDPDPKKITAQFPTVVDWAERRAKQWDGTGELAPFDAPTDFATHILGEMASTYSPYILANRDAQQVGAKAFHVEIYGEDVSYLSRPYPEAARKMVVERIRKLDAAGHKHVQAMLNNAGLRDTFG